MASRPPWVELGSTALLRPGGQTHVTDWMWRISLHLELPLSSPLWGLRGPSLRLKARGLTIPDGDTNPHFSSLVYCVAAIIRPGCVTLRRPPRRTARVRLRGPRSQALPGRPLRRLATTSDEKSGLTVTWIPTRPRASWPVARSALIDESVAVGSDFTTTWDVVGETVTCSRQSGRSVRPDRSPGIEGSA